MNPPGGIELLVILLVVLLLFGGSRLPKLARSIGQASKEFKEGVKDGGLDDTPKAAIESESEKVTMTKGELDALLAEREAKVRREDKPHT